MTRRKKHARNLISRLRVLERKSAAS